MMMILENNNNNHNYNHYRYNYNFSHRRSYRPYHYHHDDHTRCLQHYRRHCCHHNCHSHRHQWCLVGDDVIMEEWSSSAANTSCLCRMYIRPFLQGSVSWSGLKSSRKHRSLAPVTDTKQKLPNSVLGYIGPVLPLTTTDMFNCCKNNWTTSRADVVGLMCNFRLVGCGKPVS